MKRKIMILGAGVFQLPLIQKAREADLETVVVSSAGNYPGITLADVFLEIDTTDVDRVLKAARHYNIAGIVTTGSDVGVPTLGVVCDALGLRGPTARNALVASSKCLFRKLLRENGLRYPAFAVCTSIQDAWTFVQQQSHKVVVKPDDSSGSRGITILEEQPDRKSVLKAWNHAICFSRNKFVCVESFIEGREVGGDAFFKEGRLHFLGITTKHLDGVVVQGHSFPGSVTRAETESILNEIERVASALGYTDGPMNFDIILNDSGAAILEIGLRNGGNGIPDLIFRSQRIDLYWWLLEYSLGCALSEPQVLDSQEASSYVFGANKSGRLRYVSDLKTLQKRVPQVYTMVLARTYGDQVRKFTHNAELVGYLIINCGANEYSGVVGRIQEALKVTVD